MDPSYKNIPRFQIEKFRGKYPFKKRLNSDSCIGHVFAGPILKACDNFRYYGDKTLSAELDQAYHHGYTHVIIYM